MRVLLSVIAALLFLPACVQKRFIHSAPPVLNPMFKEKGQSFVSAGYTSNDGGTTESTDGINRKSGGVVLQGGYATGKHFGVAGSFFYMQQKDVYPNGYAEPFDESNVKHNRTDITLAGNYFIVSKNRLSGLNVLFGTSLGKLNITDAGKLAAADYTRYFNSHSFALFVQPSLNFYFGEYAGLGFSTKLNYVSYHNNNTDYTDAELASLRLNNTGSLYVAEFGIKGKLGFDEFPLAIEPQLNYIWNHSGRIHVRRANVSLGISWQFTRRRK